MNSLTVMGVCTYSPAVQRWLRTLRVHFDGPCQLYLVNASDAIQTALGRKYGCEVIDIQMTSDYWAAPPPGRFCHTWSCIADACLNRIRTQLVLRTDVWDVVFQGDPRDALNSPPGRVLVSAENVTLASDSQNRRWVGQWHAQIPGGPVFNGGLICGERVAVAAVARIISKNVFGTEVDQSELVILTNMFRNSFEYRAGFMECLYDTLRASGDVVDGRFVDRMTRRPWTVVHGNGSTKTLINSFYPLVESDHRLDNVLTGAHT
jgi:hypothetical protein